MGGFELSVRGLIGAGHPLRVSLPDAMLSLWPTVYRVSAERHFRPTH